MLMTTTPSFEGKTIVAPLACYLHAIARRQIHVVTVNTYLVRRDRYCLCTANCDSEFGSHQ